MKKVFTNIRTQIAKAPAKKMSAKEQEFVHRYLGTTKKIKGLATGDLVKIAKESLKNTSDAIEISSIIEALLTSKSYEEHIIGGKVFTFLKPEQKNKIPFSKLESWLKPATGWVEVDVVCQSAYTAAEVLERWHDWEKMIKKFRKSSVISLRRASLVLMVRSVRETDDNNLRELAFDTIDELKTEKEVLITKAISWLLRSLAAFKKEEVKDYILKNEQTLPKIAIREALKKIETGKK